MRNVYRRGDGILFEELFAASANGNTQTFDAFGQRWITTFTRHGYEFRRLGPVDLKGEIVTIAPYGTITA